MRLPPDNTLRHLLRVLVTNLILVALVLLVFRLALRVDPYWPLDLPRQLEWAAWLLLLPGLGLLLAAEYAFLIAGHATGAPADPPRQLVVTGIYRWVRNPIYLGDMLILFSVAFFNHSPTLLILAGLFLPAMHAMVVLIEEPRTERRLGAAYVRYKQTVSRWLPRPPPTR